jgi:hypothetical protein
VECLTQFIVRSAWKIGEEAADATRIKAARSAIAGFRLTPAELDAIARALGDYTALRYPNEAEAKEPVDWLFVDAGCKARTGTTGEARSCAHAALSAVLSILVEVPVDRCSDETALLSTLQHTRWRVPLYQRQRVARRMARHVSNLIMGEPFVPPNKRAA